MLPAIRPLLDEGHELLGIFSFDCDNVFNFNHECQALAQTCSAPFILSQAEDFHLTGFLEKGAEVFLSAGYPYKIPKIDETQAYGVNIHPTYLPHARGLMPIPRIIMDEMKDAAGFTAHKMTQEFDAGDILMQEKFTLHARETVETYSAKIAIRAPDMISKLMENLPTLWSKAKPQNEKKASNFRAPTTEERLMDWSKSVHDIDRIGRAFGRFGSLAQFKNQIWVVYDYDFWEETHSFTPGDIAAQLSREITIAAKDGFVCLKECQPANYK